MGGVRAGRGGEAGDGGVGKKKWDGGVLRRYLGPAKWVLLSGSAETLEPTAALPTARARVGELSYRKGGGRRWTRVRGRLSEGRLQLEPLAGGPALLICPLTFPLISVEDAQRRIKLLFHVDEHHHLWVPGSRAEMAAWVEALTGARDEAQRAFLRPPLFPAGHARLPADLRRSLHSLANSITHIKRSLILFRTLPPTKSSWFKPKVGVLSPAQVQELQALEERLRTLGLAWEALAKTATHARPPSPMRLKMTPSHDHIILKPHNHHHHQQQQQTEPQPKRAEADGKERARSEEVFLTALPLSGDGDSSSDSPSSASASSETTTGLTSSLAIPPPPTQSLFKPQAPDSDKTKSASGKTSGTASQPLSGQVSAGSGTASTAGAGGAEKEKTMGKAVVGKATAATRAYRKTLPVEMPESLAITLGVVMKALAENSLPLRLFEPLGTLQRMSEGLEYSALLDEAAGEGSAVRRLALVVAYAVGSLSGSVRRTGKPFNPLLGETYTLDRWEERGWRYVAEQVVHSPDVSAAAAEGRGWALSGVFHPGRPRFAFSYVALAPKSTWSLHLQAHKETYRFQPVQVRVLNPVTPALRRVHHHGTLSVLCSSGLRAELELEAGKTEVRGRIFRSERPSEGLGTLTGDWATQLSLATPAQPKPATLFRANALPPDAPSFFGFGHLARELNEVGPWERDAEGRPRVCPTDSRYRPDQRAFEEGRLEEAQRLKEALEAAQRARRKAAPGPHVPLFFRRDPAAPDPANLFLPNHSFWAARQRSFHGLSFPPIFRLP